MDDLIMGVLFAITFVVIQFGLTTLIFMWYSYRYSLGKDLEEDSKEKAKGEMLSRVIRFKPKSDARIEDKKGKFGRGFERRVWK